MATFDMKIKLKEYENTITFFCSACGYSTY